MSSPAWGGASQFHHRGSLLEHKAKEIFTRSLLSEPGPGSPHDRIRPGANSAPVCCDRLLTKPRDVLVVPG